MRKTLSSSWKPFRTDSQSQKNRKGHPLIPELTCPAPKGMDSEHFGSFFSNMPHPIGSATFAASEPRRGTFCGFVASTLALMVALALMAGERFPSSHEMLWGVAAGTAGTVGLVALYRAVAGGNSFRQGTHHDAQKLITTGAPLSPWPEKVPPPRTGS